MNRTMVLWSAVVMLLLLGIIGIISCAGCSTAPTSSTFDPNRVYMQQQCTIIEVTP